MNPIDEIQQLNLMIRKKEQEHKAEGLLLVGDFKETYESLRPINILKSTLKEVVVMPGITTTLTTAAVGMVLRYVAKKVTGEGKSNSFLNILHHFFGNKTTNAPAPGASHSDSMLTNTGNGHSSTNNP